MTQDQLSPILNTLSAGQSARTPYEVFDDIFPLGVADDGAKLAAYNLAKASGCAIENRPDDAAVWFVKG